MTTPYIIVLLRRHGSFLPVLLLVGILIGGAIYLFQPRTYEASSTIFISTTAGDEVADLQTATSVSEQRAVTYAELVNSPAVLDPVLDAVDSPLTNAALGEQINAQVIPGTSLLEITAESGSPQHAAQLVDAVSESLTELSGALEEIEGSPEGMVSLSLLETVSIPESPSGPGLLTHLGLGAAGGLVAGIGSVLLRHSLDTRIHRPVEVADITDLPVITAPHEVKNQRRSRVAAVHRREAFAALEAHLRFTRTEQGQVLLLTSPVNGKEASSAVLDLAAASVAAGRRTVVVDADASHSRTSRRLDLGSRPGLTDVLAGSTTTDQVLVCRPGSFDVLPAGNSPAHHDPGTNWEQALSDLASTYELLIIDAPPVPAGTEILKAGQLVQSTVVVAEAGSTDRVQLLATVERLRGYAHTSVGVLLLQPNSGPDAYQPGDFSGGRRQAASW